MIDTLARYNVKKRAVIYYIYSLYLSSLDALQNSLSKFVELQGDYKKLNNQHQSDITSTTSQLQSIVDKHNKLLAALRQSVTQIDNTKINTVNTGKSIENEKLLKSSLTGDNDKVSNTVISESLSGVIKNGQLLRDKIALLKTNNDKNNMESSKKLGDAEKEIEELKTNIENYRDLLKQSWPVLAATLTQDELKDIPKDVSV